MPYGVKKSGNKWVKYRTDTGRIVSHHDTKEKAKASIRAYYAQKGKTNECGDSVDMIDSQEHLDEKSFQYATIKGGKQKVTSPKQLALLNVRKLPYTAVYKSKSGKTYKVRKNVKESFYKQLMKESIRQNPITLNIFGDKEQVLIHRGKYNNGTMAVALHTIDGMPYVTLSVNVPGESEKLSHDEFFVKDYSENEDIVKQFVNQQILIPTNKSIKTGFVTVNSYKLAPFDSMNEIGKGYFSSKATGATYIINTDKPTARQVKNAANTKNKMDATYYNNPKDIDIKKSNQPTQPVTISVGNKKITASVTGTISAADAKKKAEKDFGSGNIDAETGKGEAL